MSILQGMEAIRLYREIRPQTGIVMYALSMVCHQGVAAQELKQAIHSVKDITEEVGEMLCISVNTVPSTGFR